jgi:oligoribonuclease (3'-5' exoribonuclease)
VSTLKELCRRYRPDLYEVRPNAVQPHRALPDLENSLLEFAFYRKEFLNA